MYRSKKKLESRGTFLIRFLVGTLQLDFGIENQYEWGVSIIIIIVPCIESSWANSIPHCMLYVEARL